MAAEQSKDLAQHVWDIGEAAIRLQRQPGPPIDDQAYGHDGLIIGRFSEVAVHGTNTGGIVIQVKRIDGCHFARVLCLTGEHFDIETAELVHADQW